MGHARDFYTALKLANGGDEAAHLIGNIRSEVGKAWDLAIKALHSPAISLMDLRDVVNLRCDICEVFGGFEPTCVTDTRRRGICNDTAKHHRITSFLDGVLSESWTGTS